MCFPDYIRSTRNLAVDLPGRMLPSLQKSVVGSADKWSHRLQDVLSEAASDTINESYKKYMHYKEKVSKMAQEKRSGKLTSSSQVLRYSSVGRWLIDAACTARGLREEPRQTELCKADVHETQRQG